MDLTIRGGKIVDGTGVTEPFVGDGALRSGSASSQLLPMGSVDLPARALIDARLFAAAAQSA